MTGAETIVTDRIDAAPPPPLHPDGLLALLDWCERHQWQFVPPTPATHAHRLASSRLPPAGDARQILGWSRPFDPADADAGLLARLRAADALEETPEGLRARVRVSRLAGLLLCHSAYPTDAADAVFLGPDTYRYARLVARELPLAPPGTIVDIGSGSGAAAILAARARPQARVIGTDINPAALAMARVNARHNGVTVDFSEGSGIEPVAGAIALAVSNPPFMVDTGARLYRHGGELHGLGLGLSLVEAVLPRLAPQGRMLLFTGNPIIDGRDLLHERLRTLADMHGCRLFHDEIDPDVYGEELANPAYHDAERIALVGAVLVRP